MYNIAHKLPSVLFHKVILLTSSNDAVAQSLAAKLQKRTGCQVMKVGKKPQNNLEEVMKNKSLDWKHVAFMGKTTALLFLKSSVGRLWKRVTAESKCIYHFSLASLCFSVPLSGFDQADEKLLKLAGLSAVPGDAPELASKAAKYICHLSRGSGAVWDFAEHIFLHKPMAKP